MNKKPLNHIIVSSLLLMLLTIFAVRTPITRADATVYIRADGRIEPDTVPIVTLDNITYTFTGDILDEIIIERSNITVNGAGHLVEGVGSGRGVSLRIVSNVTVKSLNIRGFYHGVYFNSTTTSSLLDSNITANSNDGIRLYRSTMNNITQNIVTSNGNDGIKIMNFSDSNTVSGNTITASNDDGIQLTDCSNNIVEQNNITGNTDVGIYSLSCTGNIINGNEVSGNRYGIEFLTTSGSSLEGNTIFGNAWYGIWLDTSADNTAAANNITDNYDGIFIEESSLNRIYKNNITANGEHGIWLEGSPNNRIERNNLTANTNSGIYIRYSARNHMVENILQSNNNGIWFSGSSNNTILQNTVEGNQKGIRLLFGSSNDKFRHNNFVNNVQQVEVDPGYVSSWDDDFEGNYWSNYLGADLNNDGIGDAAYTIDANNRDDYPLMGVFSQHSTILGFDVDVISNSTVEDFEFYKSPANSTIRMYVSNMTTTQTAGFCRVAISHFLMTEQYDATIDGGAPSYSNYTVFDNGTHRWIYFSYSHSTLEVVIRGLDSEAPTIDIIMPENATTYTTSNVPLTYMLHEPTQWVGYSLDEQTNTTTTGNTTITATDGPHTITVYANDTFGHMGSSDTVQFTVDTVIPLITILWPENTTYATTSIDLIFTVNKPTSWIGYSLDEQTNTTTTGNTTLASLTDGSHTIVVHANDTLGNMGHSATVYFTIDTSLPVIEILSPESITYSTDSVGLVFTLDKPVVWTGYIMDGQPMETILGNTTLMDLSDGTHRIIVYANDTLGRMVASDLVYFTVDTAPPDITSITQDPDKDNVGPEDTVRVNATVADLTSGVNRVTLNYTRDGETWFTQDMANIETDVWNGTIPAFPFCTNITYTITAEDNVGNVVTSVEMEYELEYHVIPEISLEIAATLFLTMTLLTAVFYRRRKPVLH